MDLGMGLGNCNRLTLGLGFEAHTSSWNMMTLGCEKSRVEGGERRKGVAQGIDMIGEKRRCQDMRKEEMTPYVKRGNDTI